MELQELVTDFAAGIAQADAGLPQAASARSGSFYQPGIGPHTEDATIRLVAIA